MEHCEPDSLTLSALGEPALAAWDVEHLIVCDRCHSDLRASHRTVVAARGPEPAAGESVEPPPDVWARIRSELGLAGATPPGTVVTGITAAEDDATGRTGRGRVARLLALAAGAVVLALAAGAAGAVLAGGDDAPPPTERLVAQARLGPLPDGPGTAGTATLVADSDGRLLQVQVEGLPRSAGYYEVWLIDPATEAMVSLGVLAGTSPADLRVPAGVDVAAYSLVDVSDEPLDGDPVHSRVSVARGQLPPAEG